MPLSKSLMSELGLTIPKFHLKDVVSNMDISAETFESKKAVLVMFICCHCPFTKHVMPEIVRIGKDYMSESIGIVGICSNDKAQHPEDGPDGLRHLANSKGLNFPICFDETQEVAKAFKAACTPEFFLFDSNRHLVYRGRLDDSKLQTAIPLTGKELRQAINSVLADMPVSAMQHPGLGCNIKWKRGFEPEYYKKALA